MKQVASILAWLFAAVVALTALALVSAHAPPRMRLIGLFAIAYGLAAGAILAWLAREILQSPPRRTLTWLALPLIVAAETGLTWESHRLWAAAVERQQLGEAAPVLLDRLETQGDVPADFKDDVAHARSQRSGFATYLDDRISPLGEWGSPWPVVFWAGEVVAGSLTGAWLVWRMLARSE